MTSAMEGTTQDTHLLDYSTTWVTFTEIIFEAVPTTVFSTEVVIFLSVLVGVLVILTAGGNLLVVIAFATTPKLRTYNNYFILGLAIADLLVAVVNMPLFAMVILLGYWPLGAIFCDMFSFMDHAFSHVSIILVALISLDRYIAVTYPIRHRQYWRRRPRAILIIAAGYIIPVIIWLPLTSLWQVINGIDKRPIPDDVCTPLYHQSFVAFWFIIFLFGIIPFSITSVCCARIYYALRRFYKGRLQLKMMITEQTATNSIAGSSQNSGNPGTGSGKEEVSQVRKDGGANQSKVNSNIKPRINQESIKGARTLFLIAIAMWIAWFPSLIVTIMIPFCPDCVPPVVYSAAIFWGYINSLLNPICYALTDKAFKDGFIRIFTLKCFEKEQI
ncbi:muscarinic acetylcholine receptor M1-like [Lytechinus variegatus]|uniref:muscarinic acetylcholine receptor M1-like n=1 Tax=Lytechinus variegatus TaxID=7654 RepID=UPI001BB24245|nr:muscarinic acetylcholine receptor M1-like [Lytechinus variegatus]